MFKFRSDASTEEEKWRKIVVAMDDSGHSKHALKWYIDNIYRNGDSVIIVHAVNKYEDKLLNNPEDPDRDRPQEKADRAELRKRLESFQQMLEDAKLMGEVKVVCGKTPGKGIVNAVEEINADAVCMGTRGLGALKRAIIGSVSHEVIHASKVPIFVCKGSI